MWHAQVVSPSRRPLSVLHTADVHLDSDGGGPGRQAEHNERGRQLFRRIVDRALADQVDLVLIAGDLFDHNRASDETIAFVRRELDRLRQPVVILPGNHDCLATNAIYDRHDFTARTERPWSFRASRRSCGAAAWNRTSPHSSLWPASRRATRPAGRSRSGT